MSYDDCDYAPRRKVNAAAASAVNVNTNPPSDISIQREYFLQRLYTANSNKQTELVKLYNLFVNNSPKSAKDLIAAIEGKKYKLDTRKLKKLEEAVEDGESQFEYMGNTYGIIWDGPEADRKGYDLALIEMGKQYNTAKDDIMGGDAADMKKAVATFSEWLPKNKKN